MKNFLLLGLIGIVQSGIAADISTKLKAKYILERIKTDPQETKITATKEIAINKVSGYLIINIHRQATITKSSCFPWSRKNTLFTDKITAQFAAFNSSLDGWTYWILKTDRIKAETIAEIKARLDQYQSSPNVKECITYNWPLGPEPRSISPCKYCNDHDSSEEK